MNPDQTSAPETPLSRPEDFRDEGAGPLPPPPAAEMRATPTASTRRSTFFEVSLVVALALFIALVLKVYVAEAYEIRGKSMQKTFEDGERVMMLKVLYEIRRGDIIIFPCPHSSQKDLIKRVIGLPGDHLEVRNGVVFINGTKLEEPYLGPIDGGGHAHMVHEYRRKNVPAGKYYVLGDNRPQSQDSRVFDVIDGSCIKGKVVCRWWPLERFESF